MTLIRRSDFKLGPAEKMDARQALLILEGSGLSLAEAARRALLAGDGQAPVFKSVPLAEALREFIADLHRRQRRMSTLDFYEQRMEGFAASPLGARWQRVERADLRAWLDGLKCGAVTRAMTFRTLRAFYRWAQRHEPAWCGKPPTDGIVMEGEQGDRSSPEFYTVDAVERLLAGCGADMRPAIAAQLFAGLRPEEVAPKMGAKTRIGWEDFNFEERIVRVPAAVAKTRVVRLIEDLPEALWAWLETTPVARRKGPLWTQTYDHLRAKTCAALRGRGRSTPDDGTSALPGGETAWIRDGLRHTFASYAVALTRDAGQVSEWLGHEGQTRLLQRNYKSAVLRGEAVRFFALRPNGD